MRVFGYNYFKCLTLFVDCNLGSEGERKIRKLRSIDACMLFIYIRCTVAISDDVLSFWLLLNVCGRDICKFVTVVREKKR